MTTQPFMSSAQAVSYHRLLDLWPWNTPAWEPLTCSVPHFGLFSQHSHLKQEPIHTLLTVCSKAQKNALHIEGTQWIFTECTTSFLSWNLFFNLVITIHSSALHSSCSSGELSNSVLGSTVNLYLIALIRVTALHICTIISIALSSLSYM